ncbi:Tubulin-folding cofactor B [Intoshia linei]|uniref:Tubulin-folding cofactor B n=1 Tax=Intoshia linei TaxID=1819745 RepID=A0A177B046_9BILA|nr:Tubulin-folding cofactor B [Intoshia linei]
MSESYMLHIKNEDSSYDLRKRFQSSLSIKKLKNRLEMMVGILSDNMILEATFIDGKCISLDKDENLLSDIPLADDVVVKVTGKPINMEPVEDSGFKLSYDVYEKKESNIHYINYYNRMFWGYTKFNLTSTKLSLKLGKDINHKDNRNSLLSFKKQHKLGRFNPDKPENNENDEILSFTVGSRCEVNLNGQRPKRGVVKYTGVTDFSTKNLIGIQYDEPLGNHNGTYKNKTYFTCPEKCGAFVKPTFVKCGDYPEEIDEI